MLPATRHAGSGFDEAQLLAQSFPRWVREALVMELLHLDRLSQASRKIGSGTTQSRASSNRCAEMDQSSGTVSFGATDPIAIALDNC